MCVRSGDSASGDKVPKKKEEKKSKEDNLYEKLMPNPEPPTDEEIRQVVNNNDDERAYNLFPGMDEEYEETESMYIRRKQPDEYDFEDEDEDDDEELEIEVPKTKKTRKMKKEKREEKERKRKEKAIVITAEIDEHFSEKWVEVFVDICNRYDIPITFFICPRGSDDHWEYRTNYIKRRFRFPEMLEFGTHGWVHQSYSHVRDESEEVLVRHIAWQSDLAKYHRAPYFDMGEFVENLLVKLKFVLDSSGKKKQAEIKKDKSGLVRVYLTDIKEGKPSDILRDMVKHVMRDKLIVLSFKPDKVGCTTLNEFLNVLKANNLLHLVIPLRNFVAALG